MTIAISSIQELNASLRRRTGDINSTTYSSGSLDSYLYDGFNFIEQLLTLGYTTSITGTTLYVDPTPDNNAKILVLAAAEYLVKNDKAMQLIDNAIMAKDGPQSIDTSKAVNAAVEMAENARRSLDNLINDFKINGTATLGYRINNYNEEELSTTWDGKAL